MYMSDPGHAFWVANDEISAKKLLSVPFWDITKKEKRKKQHMQL